ncbi:MAG: low specificity L-threonine aldolase [Rhodobacteraceae bacterium]|nr:low specificity L-threonine aldolase [Paracoccaceae bacterium]
MNFASDHTGPAHPAIIDALANANTGYMPSYGSDPLSGQLQDRIRDIFEAPEAIIFLVPTGTAANALILATLSDPWQEIYAAEHSHIREDECNAVEHFTGGARITKVNAGDFLDPVALRNVMENAAPHGHHNAQQGPVSITQVTDLGRVYALDQIAEISAVARDFGQPLHMDGARFANALVALGCTPAQMTWRAGVDALSLGGTKNGCLGVEATVFFDPKHAWEFELRRKRAGILASKSRFMAAQMLTYLGDDLWLDLARRANGAAARLVEGLSGVPGVTFNPEPQANMIFATMPAALHRRALAAGAIYEVHGDPSAVPDETPLGCRIVCDWSSDPQQIDRFVAVIRG